VALEYIIYTDESDKTGKYFSNFYGGILIRSSDLQDVIQRLENAKIQLHLHREVKWQNVTQNYLEKYRSLIDRFFDEVEADRVKVRIMFTQNQFIPIGLSSEQRRAEYHMLYYQFVKHAFGLRYSGHRSQHIGVRLYMDQLPTNREQNAQFKAFLVGLNQNAHFRAAGIRFHDNQIAEVDSREHVLLQCLDIVLGSMAFRLNDKHKEKPAGRRRRSKRTIAKDRLYKHIYARICRLYPRFNIGESTGTQGDRSNLWRHRYRHWKFVPKRHRRDPTRTKRKK
jgi:hypothetical protein